MSDRITVIASCPVVMLGASTQNTTTETEWT